MPSANPDVDSAPNPELADVEEVAPDEIPEVEAETTETEPTTAGGEPTSRRSRAEARGERQKGTAANLDESPEFRAWKAEADRREAALRKQLREAETIAAQREEAQQQAQLEQMARHLDEEIDPTRRQALVEQMAGMRAQKYMREWREWSDYVSEQAQQAGLDPKQFDPAGYKTREAFERDLLEAKGKKTEKELSELRQKTDPQALEKLIEQRVAAALREHGLDVVETAAPESPPTPALIDWQRDSQAVQLGRMTPQAYLKKWGNKTPT